MGMIAERTKSRWGRLRPYLLFGAVPLGIASVLMFSTPDFSDAGKIWWAYTTYILFGILFTVVGIPYSALTSSLTSNTSLSWRTALRSAARENPNPRYRGAGEKSRLPAGLDPWVGAAGGVAPGSRTLRRR